MGRFYEGDINGKFWFAVQPSDDGEFFGAIIQNNSEEEIEDSGWIEYRIPKKEKHGAVEKGINRCLASLGQWEEWLDDFFKANESYNEDSIITFIAQEKDTNTTTEEVKSMLKWYARLYMGRKIELVFNEVPDYDLHFTAEI
jgi:hypothetical protein